MVLGTEFFESPAKVYTAFRALDLGINRYAMIGVSDGEAPGLQTSLYYPGYSADKGVALYGSKQTTKQTKQKNKHYRQQRSPLFSKHERFYARQGLDVWLIVPLATIWSLSASLHFVCV